MAQQINLYSPLVLAQKKYFSATAMAQALGLVLAGVVLIDFFAAQQTVQLSKQLEAVQRDTVQRRDQLVTLSKQFSDQGRSKTLDEDIVRVEEQLRKRSDLLQQMKTSAGSNQGGFSAYLTALARRPVEGVWLTGIEMGGASTEIAIRGRALSAELVPVYVRSLSAQPEFAGLSLSSLQVIAREEPARAEAPPPGPEATPPVGAPPVSTPPVVTSPAAPLRYVEFVLNIPLGNATGGASAAPPRGAS